MILSKEQIIELSKKYLADSECSKELIEKLILKGDSSVLQFNRLTLSEIQSLLEQRPNLSNIYYKGWHSLHYAALNPDYNVFKAIFYHSVNKGDLKILPSTKIEKRSIPIDTPFVDFCIREGLDQVLASILCNISNPDKLNYQQFIYIGMHFKSNKCILLLNNIVSNHQEIMFEYYKHSPEHFFRECLKLNPSNFKHYDIDLQYRDEERNTYFSTTLKGIIDNYSFYQYNDTLSLAGTLKDVLSYFFKNGFSFDENNNNQQSPRSIVLGLFQHLYIPEVDAFIKTYDKEKLDLSLTVKSIEHKTIKIKI